MVKYSGGIVILLMARKTIGWNFLEFTRNVTKVAVDGMALG